MYFYPASIVSEIDYCKRHLYYLQTAELTSQIVQNITCIALNEAERQIFEQMRQKLIELTEQRISELEQKAEKFKFRA